MPRVRILVLTLFLLNSYLLITPNSWATALKYRNFSDLVYASDAIIQGQVQEISSRRMDNGAIVSFVTLSNISVIRGQYQAAEFTLVHHGGEVNGLVQKIQGSPTFEVSQSIILFLQGNGQRMVPLTGWGQGMFIVSQNQVFDYQQNPVLAIIDNQVLVKRLVAPDVILVGAPQAREIDETLSPMSREQFIQTINRFEPQTTPKPITSIRPDRYVHPKHKANEPVMRGQ